MTQEHFITSPGWSFRQGEDDVKGLANVKTVLDVNGYALYFSRAMIPHNKKGVFQPATHYWRKLVRRRRGREGPTAAPGISPGAFGTAQDQPRG